MTTSQTSLERNLGQVSFTYTTLGLYGTFINLSRLAAWQFFLRRHNIDRSRIVDVGCSSGSWRENWKNLGFKRLIGVDPNPEVLDEARRRFDEVFRGFGHELSRMIRDVDIVAAHAVLVHILEPEENVRFLRGLRDAIRPGGYVVFTGINAKYYMSVRGRERAPWVDDRACTRSIDEFESFAREADLTVIERIGTFIDPWALTDLEFLADQGELRNRWDLYSPFLELSELLRPTGIVPFSEVLFVCRRPSG